MSIPLREQKILCFASGGVCAFPDCGANLVNAGAAGDETIIGEFAHIVAEQRQGPRGREGIRADDKNKASNLILLCATHHTVIDRNPHIYSVHVLRQMKADHEKGMAAAAKKRLAVLKQELIEETVHSTLLRLLQLPRYVYSGMVPEYSARAARYKRRRDAIQPKIHRPEGHAPQSANVQ